MIDPKKKIMNLIFSGVYIILVVFTMTVISFSWLPKQTRTGSEIKYNKDLIISSLDLDIEFQIFDSTYSVYRTIAKYENNVLAELDDQTHETIDYGVKSVKLNPGDKQSYRFVITNTSESSDIIADVSIKGFFQKVVEDGEDNYSPEDDIFSKLAIMISSPDMVNIPVLRTNMTSTGTGANESLNLDFYQNLTVPQGETINLDWYIELSTTAGNEFWGYSFGFDSVFFSI